MSARGAELYSLYLNSKPKKTEYKFARYIKENEEYQKIVKELDLKPQYVESNNDFLECVTKIGFSIENDLSFIKKYRRDIENIMNLEYDLEKIENEEQSMDKEDLTRIKEEIKTENIRAREFVIHAFGSYTNGRDALLGLMNYVNDLGARVKKVVEGYSLPKLELHELKLNELHQSSRGKMTCLRCEKEVAINE